MAHLISFLESMACMTKTSETLSLSLVEEEGLWFASFQAREI